MNLIRYRPSNLDLFDFDRLYDRYYSRPAWNGREPAVDVREDEDAYYLEVEVPGLSEKDISVSIDDSLLTIASKQEDQQDEKQNGYVMRERRKGTFSRSFLLPKGVDRDKIDGSFKDGVLVVTVAKAAEAKPRTIEVKSA